MSASLFVTLLCCAAAPERPHALYAHLDATVSQLDALYVAIEATPTELYVGDVVFVSISVTNKGKQPVVLPGWLSPFLDNLRLYLNDWKRESRVTLPPYGHGIGGADPRRLRPGERWVLLGYSPVHVPRIESTGDPFWNPQGLSEHGYDLSVSLILTPRVHVLAPGPTLKIRPRPEAELTKVLELCGTRRGTSREIRADWASRPNLNWFAFPLAPPEASTTENLATLEAVLSPGTLRDLVRLTRRAHAVYAEEGVAEKRKRLAELLTWLETFPDVQRQCMTEALMDWVDDSKGLGVFAYEITVEVALRPALLKGDLETRRAWLKGHLKSPLAAPYLKDFEERIKTVEKGRKEGGSQRDPQAQEGPQ